MRYRLWRRGLATMGNIGFAELMWFMEDES